MDKRIPMMVSQEMMYMTIWGYKLDNKTAEFEIEELTRRGDDSFIPELRGRIENNNKKVSDLESIMSEHWEVSKIGGTQ